MLTVLRVVRFGWPHLRAALLVLGGIGVAGAPVDPTFLSD
jgi:hypothetical protein